MCYRGAGRRIKAPFLERIKKERAEEKQPKRGKRAKAVAQTTT